MKRPLRVTLVSAGSLLLVLLVVGIMAVLVVQSSWFFNKVRERIITVAETATGGRVEIDQFRFDWRTLTATVNGFTLHGSEPVSGPPLLYANEVVVGLKIVSIFKRDVDIALLHIEKPRAFVLVALDGTTNVPKPKTKSNQTPTATILDLAIGHFDLNKGSAEIHVAGQPPKTHGYAAKGDNLRAVFAYDTAVPRYHGDVSAMPLHLVSGGFQPVDADVDATVSIEKNRIVLEKSRIKSGDSEFSLNGRLQNFSAPVITGEYRAKVQIAQVGSFLKLRSRQSGWVEANGSGTYKSDEDYAFNGVVKAYSVSFQMPGISLRNARAQAKIDGGPKSISFKSLVADALGGQFSGKADITNFANFKLDGEAKHFDIRAVAALVTSRKLPYDGVASGPVSMEGKLADLNNSRFLAGARLDISPAAGSIPVHGKVDARYDGYQSTLDFAPSFLEMPNTRLDFQGKLGQTVKVHFLSSNLDDLLPAMEATPVTLAAQGQVVFDGSVSGKLEDPSIAGHLGGSNFIVQDQKIDSVNADIIAQASRLTVSNGRLRQNTVDASFTVNAGLRNWQPDNDQPVQAALALENADLPALLALAGKKTSLVSGTLRINAKISGTIGSPQATADATLTKGQLHGEPFDRLTAHLDAPNRGTQTLKAQLSAGSRQISLDASYAHSAADLFPGELSFRLATNKIAMSQIAALHAREPDVSGEAVVTADGMIRITKNTDGRPAFTFEKINVDANATGVQVAAHQLGDLHLTAATVTPGGPLPQMEVKLRSNLADAVITADGKWTLAGDYPGAMKLDFTHVNLDTVRRLVLTPQQAESIRAGGSIEGSLSISGPAAKPEQIQATLEVPKLVVEPLPSAEGAPPPSGVSLRNSGPIRITMANEVVRVESAHLIAMDSDFTLTGQATLAPKQDLDLHVNGSVNLAIIHTFYRDVISSGGVVANASIRGSLSDPQLGGSIQLKNANLALIDIPNGLSNANGTITFSGAQATLQDLTGESGGGKVRLGGFASLAGGSLAFRLRADATGVRLRYPQGVSTLADAQLTLVGTTERSVLSGTISVERLAFNPKTDLGSILASAAVPPETPSGATGVTRSLQFDVQIQTAPDITFQSNYTQSIEADASLRLRGTIANPVLIGRINITQGELTFFGNKYTINQGSVSFFNPVKLEPILNIDLETVARGVDVTLTVSGPISKLNVSYRSDPPLQFADIVALLATGRAPNDATIAARQPTAPQQSWQQMGASALVGQTIANPVAGRLQRFFGVSSLKIDPTISGVTGNPQAQVTLEQQITPEITFTYITDVTNAQEQVIRVEWAFSQHWSAVALRDQNGEFGIDFLYKKRFK